MSLNTKAIDLKRADRSYALAEQQAEAERKRRALAGGALAVGLAATLLGLVRRANPFRPW